MRWKAASGIALKGKLSPLYRGQRPRVRQEARKEQLVRIQPMQSVASSIEPNSTQQEVTNVVKLEGGTRQAVTQVKELSPEIDDIIEADIVRGIEGSKWDSIKGELSPLYRGRRPQHGLI